MLTHPEVNEALIERLVRAFYERAREDAVIGPIFNASVADWDHPRLVGLAQELQSYFLPDPHSEDNGFTFP